MSSGRRKAVDTSLFRPKEDREDAPATALVDMSPASETRTKRASFDLREDQIKALGVLKYSTGKKISDLAQEAIDDLLAKYA